MPDARTGAINGRVAIMGWPDSGTTDGCTVHLTESADETREHSYACGVWFQPPVGRYLFWIARGDEISFQSVVYYAGEPFRGAGSIFTKSLHSAGFVELDRKVELSPKWTFRLLSLQTIGSFRPFDRRIAASNARQRVAMPIGSALAGVFDERGRPVALTPPRRIEHGLTIAVHPDPPSGAALLVVLNRFVRANAIPSCDPSLAINGEAQRAPDVNFSAFDRVVLVWYAVESSGNARLEVRCDSTPAFLRDVSLSRGAIAMVRADLPKHPAKEQAR